MSERPAHRESSRRAFDGRVFRVDVDRVRLPHGTTVDMEVVRHPVSVVLLPFDEHGRLVLVRQYRYAVDRWLWELPAGTTDPGETPEAAAIRECAEETQLRADGVEPLGTFYPTPGFCDEAMVFFKLTGLRAAGPDDPVAHIDPDESFEIRTFTLDEVRARIARGEIADMKTIVGVSLCLDLGGRREAGGGRDDGG